MAREEYTKWYTKNLPFYEGGLLCSTTHIFDTFTWRIPNILSIPHEIDYVVQSPPFTSDDATWILKMYPYGQTIRGSKGYIDLVLERLHSSLVKQEFLVHIFCKDVNGKVVTSVNKNYLFVSGVSTEFRELNFMQSLKDSTDKERIAPNDTFTLVCAIGKKMSINGMILQDKSSEHNMRERRNRSSKNPKIGEIFREYSHSKRFFVKICKIAVVPDSYQIHEQFIFANAIWDLKMNPHFRVTNSSKRYFDVILERLQSEVSEHNISFDIAMVEPLTHTSAVERSFFFNAFETEGGVITFHLMDDNGEQECLHFEFTIRNKWSDRFKSDFPSKSTEQGSCNSTSNDSMSLSCINAVAADLKGFFLKQEGCDATLIVKGQEFHAHRAILRARSAVFDSAFRNDMIEKATGTVKIDDCEPSSFSDFLIFLYSGNVEKLSTENAFNLFVAADKYDVQDLRLLCMEFIKKNLSLSTFYNTVTLAIQYSEEELLQLSIDFLAKNLQDIIITVEWQHLLVENPIRCNELLIKALKFNKN